MLEETWETDYLHLLQFWESTHEANCALKIVCLTRLFKDSKDPPVSWASLLQILLKSKSPDRPHRIYLSVYEYNTAIVFGIGNKAQKTDTTSFWESLFKCMP